MPSHLLRGLLADTRVQANLGKGAPLQWIGSYGEPRSSKVPLSIASDKKVKQL